VCALSATSARTSRSSRRKLSVDFRASPSFVPRERDVVPRAACVLVPPDSGLDVAEALVSCGFPGCHFLVSFPKGLCVSLHRQPGETPPEEATDASSGERGRRKKARSAKSEWQTPVEPIGEGTKEACRHVAFASGIIQWKVGIRWRSSCPRARDSSCLPHLRTALASCRTTVRRRLGNTVPRARRSTQSRFRSSGVLPIVQMCG
jgi:hypothetical protein